MNKNREKQVVAILDELIKDKPEIILKLAVSEIWAKGTTHFSDKTLNATIGYWEEEQQKNAQRNQIISVDVQISVYRSIQKILREGITVFDLMKYLVKKKMV